MHSSMRTYIRLLTVGCWNGQPNTQSKRWGRKRYSNTRPGMGRIALRHLSCMNPANMYRNKSHLDTARIDLRSIQSILQPILLDILVHSPNSRWLTIQAEKTQSSLKIACNNGQCNGRWAPYTRSSADVDEEKTEIN